MKGMKKANRGKNRKLDAQAAVASAQTLPGNEVSYVWPEPSPLKTLDLLPVEPFDQRMVPESLWRYIKDIADLMQASIDFCAAALIVMLSGAVGRRARIQPKAKDMSWQVVPNLYGGIIAEPGFMKSPVISAVHRALAAIEQRWADQYAQEMADYNEAEEAEGGEKGPKPIQKRILINDATFEKLHAILAENPAGVMVLRDELTGWLAELERKTREGERGFYLEAWNGDTGRSSDRIGRGTTYAPAICIAMFGGIQPQPLREYLSGGRGQIRLSDDGLLQRFQVLVWPDVTNEYTYTDREPDYEALRIVKNVIEHIVVIDPEKPLQFKFAPDAQDAFVGWLTELEETVRGKTLSRVMRGHMAKYKSLLPSLALLFQLTEMAAAKPRGGKVGFGSMAKVPRSVGFDSSVVYEVSYENLLRAFYWTRYLQSHAERVYAGASFSKWSAAIHLIEKVLEAGEDTFSERDIQRRGLKGLDTLDKVKAACEELGKAKWIKKIFKKDREKQIGRPPSSMYQINPRVKEVPGLLYSDAQEE